jgi:two-component system, NarL family, nitrate/nitrite response regulator NarL
MSQLSVVLVHPNRLFSDGLTKICENGRYKLIYAGASYDPSHSDRGGVGEAAVFIVGGHNAAEQVRALRASYPRSIILFVGEDGQDEEINQCLAAGANCYLRETTNGDLLLKTLDIFTQNEVVLCTDSSCQKWPRGEASPSYGPIAETAVTARAPVSKTVNGFAWPLPDCGATAPHGLQLSAQEAVILRGLVEGYPNKIIANRLQITEATVKVHVKAILRKIRAKNRTQAAIWAVRHLTPLHADPSSTNGYPREQGLR